tara:strand:- start:2788 stop:3678 length:891 start_codon:yes stop_codon:yes gene_type:complete
MLSNEAKEKLGTEKFDYPVSLKAIQTVSSSFVIPFEVGRAVFREDTQEAISIVGKNYKLVPHKSLYQTVNRELDNSYREFNNIDVTDQVFDKGALVKRTIVCKDEQYKVNIPTKNGDDFQYLRFDIYNSYNMKMAFHFVFGGYGGYCANLQVFNGKAFVKHYGKHTINLQDLELVNDIGRLVDNYLVQANRMSTWGVKELPRLDYANTFFKNTMCRGSKHTANKVNQKRLEVLNDIFSKEKERWGNTVWSLYNAMTHWSTHNFRGKARTPKFQMTRQSSVRKALSSSDWNSLLQVA